MPLVITHGWPGSVIEMLNVVGPLTDPTAHGGPATTGWDPDHIARPWTVLMKRLGYTRFGFRALR